MAGTPLRSTILLKQIYHQTFEIRQGSSLVARHTLLVNPQSITVTEPARVNVTQTLGGAYVADFGQGIAQVTISVVTGYSARYNDDAELRDGYTELKHFRDEIYRKFIKANTPSYVMYWFDWENEEYYIIQPTSFRLQRSVSEPLFYRYEFQFTCLRKVSGVVHPQKLQPPVGVSTDFSVYKVSLQSALSNISEAIGRVSGLGV